MRPVPSLPSSSGWRFVTGLGGAGGEKDGNAGSGCGLESAGLPASPLLRGAWARDLAAGGQQHRCRDRFSDAGGGLAHLAGTSLLRQVTNEPLRPRFGGASVRQPAPRAPRPTPPTATWLRRASLPRLSFPLLLHLLGPSGQWAGLR